MGYHPEGDGVGISIHLDTDIGGDTDDLLNFHYDPLACAVAAGWDGARVVTGADGPRLEREWAEAVTSLP